MLMQKGGAHISSWFVPVSLLPQLGAEDVPIGAELKIPTQRPNQSVGIPTELNIWTRFEPTSPDHDDGFLMLLYPPPSDSESALIHQCVIRYGPKADIEPVKVRLNGTCCHGSLPTLC